MLPPILEIHAVWHPEDGHQAEPFFDSLLAHFRGTPFSGLIGGAVEVYRRSHPWRGKDDAPRPIDLPGATAGSFEAARICAVVPLIGTGLDAALLTPIWQSYLRAVLDAEAKDGRTVQVFPALLPGCRMGGQTQALVGSHQMISQFDGGGGLDHDATCRDLVQGIVQRRTRDRIKVFISHTKRAAETEDIEGLVRAVRDAIASTRLHAFFDAQDIQPGDDWSKTLLTEAQSSAMLAIRTDLYPSREWCQREMLAAKLSGLPIVTIDSVGHSEERGSFLMDHIARVAVTRTADGWDRRSIMVALNLLVDECLKRELWKEQQHAAIDREALKEAWWAAHAPEPVTLAPKLLELGKSIGPNAIRILHPDPPLGAPELDSLRRIAGLAKIEIDVMTPRQYAARGGG
jgi:hypothetical protein